MDRLNALEVFVEIVDCGSQTAAAERLGMSRAMVTRYLAQAEQWLGARLFHRSTRRLSLTPAGETSLPLCRQMLALSATLSDNRDTLDTTPQGLLRITSSQSFGQTHLAPAVAEYVARYPKTSVELLLLDRTVNLIEERVDLAIRISKQLDPSLISRQLALCRSVICATPAYLQRHGRPLQPDDLRAHNCLGHVYFRKDVWQFQKDGVQVAANVSGNLSSNDAITLLHLALADAGIAQLPTYIAQTYIASGQLQALMGEYQVDALGIHAVYASRRHISTVMRSMITFLAERFKDAPWDKAAG